MRNSPLVTIVGSGPAGVSVAFPLLRAGIHVAMIDVGKTGDVTPRPLPRFLDLCRDSTAQWRVFLGEQLSAFAEGAAISPKFRAPDNQYIFADFKKFYHISTQGFQAVGSLARGGLSNAWGAGVVAYGNADLAGFPFDSTALADSYRRVAERIGVSGATDDALSTLQGLNYPLQPPLESHGIARLLLDRARRKQDELTVSEFRFGRTRNAVLTLPLGERAACSYDNMCVFGCVNHAVYSATDDLALLLRHPAFAYRPGLFVEAIERSESGYDLRCRDIKGAPITHKSPTIVLAAGAIGSTTLALRHLGIVNRGVRLLSNPTFGFALIVPSRIGNAPEPRGFAMSQVSFAAGEFGIGPIYGYGGLFALDGLLLADIAKHIPLSRPAAIGLLRRLNSSILVGNCFLPGEWSDNVLQLLPGTSQIEVRITGRQPKETARIRELTKILRRGLRRLGAHILPGSIQPGRPGDDAHYAGTLPMRANPGDLETSVDGELAGAPGLYVADGSVLSRLPAAPHTFTVMANADRIGERIALKLRQAAA